MQNAHLLSMKILYNCVFMMTLVLNYILANFLKHEIVVAISGFCVYNMNVREGIFVISEGVPFEITDVTFSHSST